MKTKSILAGLLSAVMCVSVMASCSGTGETSSSENSNPQQSQQSETSEKSEAADPSKLTLTIRDSGKNDSIKATFFNTQNQETQEVEMTKSGEEDTCNIFTCEGDSTKYNMVSLSYGKKTTKVVTFNSFISAWYLEQNALLPCLKDRDYVEPPKYTTEIMKFRGFDKKVNIWVPDDYDANAETKYSAIYMLDGQTVLDANLDPGNNRSWNVSQHVASMMDVTDNKAILVCIETMGSTEGNYSRDDELLPDIGQPKEMFGEQSSQLLGKEFADFVCGTVVPFVEENYNVYTDAANRAICGSSYGGIGSFYIGMEHPDVFGTAGVLSASFSIADSESWIKYVNEKISSGNLPFIFMYDGCYYSDNGALSELMNNLLIDSGFPKDKIVFCKNEVGEHDVMCWSAIYPQFLEAVFTQKLAAVTSGEKVEYIDKSKQHPALNPNAGNPSDEIENDQRPDYVKNYIFFDNSETKWDKVYAYTWGGAPVNKVTGETLDIKYADWPGIELEKIEGTDIYKCPALLGVGNLIFSSGVLDSDVAKGVVAYQTVNLVYSNVDCSGKVYTIDMSVEPEQGDGKLEATKFRYPEGQWVDYTGPDHTK